MDKRTIGVKIPNDETLEAFAEVDEMKRAGVGEHFTGTTSDLLKILAAVPEVEPEPDEVETLEQANKSSAEHGTVPHDSINWD